MCVLRSLLLLLTKMFPLLCMYILITYYVTLMTRLHAMLLFVLARTMAPPIFHLVVLASFLYFLCFFSFFFFRWTLHRDQYETKPCSNSNVPLQVQSIRLAISIVRHVFHGSLGPSRFDLVRRTEQKKRGVSTKTVRSLRNPTIRR